MAEPKPESANQSQTPKPRGEEAHAALVVRLTQLYRKPVRPPKSLQPTPEAAKSKIRRLRRKRQLLIQKSRSDVLKTADPK
jgi:hypothetical protein